MRINKFLLFTVLLLSSGLTRALAAGIPNYSVDCSNSTCNPNFTVLSNFVRNDYNAIDAGADGGNITVSSQSGASPRSLRMNIINGVFPDGATTPGYNLTVNLNSASTNANAGSVYVLGDNFSNLNINLNGYSGKAGKDASELCADNIKSNLYGPDTLSFFTNFRLNNPSTSSSRCSLDDLNFLQSNKFKCDSGFTEDVTTNSIYSVNVQRIPKVNRCQTNLTYDVCLRQKVVLACNWNIYNGTSSITGSVGIGSNLITNAYTVTGNLTNGSTTVTTASNIVGVSVGQSVTGTGIPTNTTVATINGSTITLSNPANVTATNASLFTGVSVGQAVFSQAFPVGTVVNSISGTTITTSLPSTIDNTAMKVSTSSATSFATSISRKIPQNEYTYLKNFMSDSDICNLHVAQEISDPTYQTPPAIVNPITSNPNSFAGCSGACQWKVSSMSSNLTTPGLNGNQLASGSDWDLINTTPGNHCDTGTNPNTGFFTNLKTVNVNYVAYDVTNSSCNAADIVTFSGGTMNLDYPAQSLDPNKNAVWFYTGAAQEPDFGTEVIECDLGNCPVSSVVSDLNQTLDTIIPQNGENGSKQGAGLVMIYDAKSITTTSNVGVAGAGGKNDIINQATNRVCSKIRDATTDGLTSDYARSPLVNFNRYNWSAIKTNNSGNPGQQPVNTGASVIVWKKLDSSVRAFLQNELFNQ
jgi:hypothetical protein